MSQGITLEEVLEQLGGFEYFPPCYIHYIYHRINGRQAEAEKYFPEILQCQEKDRNLLKKFEEKVVQRIADIDNDLQQIENSKAEKTD